MCGKAGPYRQAGIKITLAFLGTASKCEEKTAGCFSGKAQPFRTSGGRATTEESFMFSHRNHATKAYVGIGSNLGDRAGNLLLAVRGITHASMTVTCLSSIYETEPVSDVEQPPFLNMVAEIGSPLPTPEQVMARLLRIEFALGRVRDVKDGPRTIDLDLLFYGDMKSEPEFLRLPNP